jgi:hypothetical protein
MDMLEKKNASGASLAGRAGIEDSENSPIQFPYHNMHKNNN